MTGAGPARSRVVVAALALAVAGCATVRHLLEGVGTRRDLGAAVAAHVVAQHTVLLRERRHMVVPEGERGAEPVGQRDDGSAGGAFKPVVGLHLPLT